MEGPGGYQFVGRTVQMWNRHRTTREFEAGKPWLLRFFDEIRFYEVSEAELAELRADFVAGRAGLKIEESVFDLGAYNRFLRDEADSIAAFKTHKRRSKRSVIGGGWPAMPNTSATRRRARRMPHGKRVRSPIRSARLPRRIGQRVERCWSKPVSV